MTSASGVFTNRPGFCSDCGSALPLLRDTGNVICYICSTEYPAEAFGATKMRYTIEFNSREAFQKQYSDGTKKEENEGPIIDRKCNKCGNGQMSYAALQLRSADEGQTVFYTCTKCNYKEAENS